MNRTRLCIGTIQDWLLEMTPERLEAAEDAVHELRSCVSGATPDEARALVVLIRHTTTLARAANSLWEQVAVDTGAPAYSVRI